MPPHCPLPIVGVARTTHFHTATTPVQTLLNQGERARIDVDHRYLEALSGITEFDYLWLLTWLGDTRETDNPRQESAILQQIPYLRQADPEPVGIFAMRGPRRISPIGLSLVRLLALDGAVLHFAGVDLVDGTPVLDIKPYVTAFDRPEGPIRCGWFDTVPLPPGATPQSLRPSTGRGDRE